MDGSHSLLFRLDSSLALRWEWPAILAVKPIRMRVSRRAMSLGNLPRDIQDTFRPPSFKSRRALGAVVQASFHVDDWPGRAEEARTLYARNEGRPPRAWPSEPSMGQLRQLIALSKIWLA